jgi:hypothetical protein
MNNPRSIALINPVSIFLVVIAVFVLLGALGRLMNHMAW